MVTHSKFPAAGMSRPLDTSLRLKTFSSKSEYQLVVNTVRKLQESGFYWSTVTGGEANMLLSTEPAGTFLIRDSSDQRHFFTLSVKTESGTKNLRIQCEGGSFSLQSDPRSSQPVPRFDCVLKLVHHYMPPAPCAVPEQPGEALHPKRTYYIYSGGEKIPLVLSRPLSSSVSTLQHLCRKTVNGHLDSYEKMTQLPTPIKEFLDQYDAPLSGAGGARLHATSTRAGDGHNTPPVRGLAGHTKPLPLGRRGGGLGRAAVGPMLWPAQPGALGAGGTP